MDSHTRDGSNINIKAFSNDVLIYSIGQFILLIFGFIQSLIIPKYLSTADYGFWQLFLLCTTYVGILHIGFLNGILIQWAGKEFKDIRRDIPIAFRFILVEQGIIVGILLLTVGLMDIPSKEIILLVLVNAVIVNLLMFFIIIAQTTKHFKLVTAANIGKGLLFLIFILIIFFSGYFSYYLLIFATMVTGLIMIFLLTIYYRESLFQSSTHERSLFQYGKENINIGIFILLGNFIALIFFTIDRLTVGMFFSITQFAIYAFAMTLCGLALVFLQAVAQVFFPYLSSSASETRIKAYSQLRPALVIFWAGVLAAYFPFTIGIRYYLPNYTESLSLMAILFCTIGFGGQINILHANFFSVYRKQKVYFVVAVVSLIAAVVLNLFAVLYFETLTAVAIIAVINFSIWYLLNELALRHLVAFSLRDITRWFLLIWAYICAFIGAYVLTETWLIGFGIYLLLFTGITIICLRREVVQLWSIFKMIIKKKEMPDHEQ